MPRRPVVEDLVSITGLLMRLAAHQRRHDCGPQLLEKRKGNAARSNDERRPTALSEARLLTLSPSVARSGILRNVTDPGRPAR